MPGIPGPPPNTDPTPRPVIAARVGVPKAADLMVAVPLAIKARADSMNGGIVRLLKDLKGPYVGIGRSLSTF